MGYSVRQAAGMVGLSRKTLYAHISQGKLSASRDASGDKVIDKAELLRVYGKLLETPETGADRPDRQDGEDLEGLEALRRDLDKAKQNASIMMANLQNLRRENELLRSLLEQARQREQDLTRQHRATLSIFERMLPKQSEEP